ncbi:MAG: hypothetical protein MOGMAGMI_02293 [Candidatus Omnitrophica bacterium]|nr:hypothetical protein [Candidatus Omnitrophota bacterium]
MPATRAAAERHYTEDERDMGETCPELVTYQPGVAEVLKAAALAIQSNQYVEDYAPDYWDGTASYSDEAGGELIDMIGGWDRDSLDALTKWSEHNAPTATEHLAIMAECADGGCCDPERAAEDAADDYDDLLTELRADREAGR